MVALGVRGDVDGIAIVVYGQYPIMTIWRRRNGVARGNFSPLRVLSNTVVWLDAKDYGSFAFSSDVNISSWSDRSGLGNGASQITASAQPHYVAAGAAGLPEVLFDGVSQHFSFGDNTDLEIGSSDFYAIMVVRLDDVAGAPTLLGKFDAGASARESLLYITGAGELGFLTNSTGLSPGNTVQNSTNASLVDGQFHVLEYHRDATVGTFRLDGVALTDAGVALDATVFAGTADALLGSSTGTADFLEGAFREVIIAREAPSVAVQDQLYRYVFNKWAMGSPDAPVVWSVPASPTLLSPTAVFSDIPPNVNDSLYRHHSYLYSDGTTLYLAYTVGDVEEDGKGQFIEWATTVDGTTWTHRGTLFPGIDDIVSPRGPTNVRTPGLILHPGQFLQVNGKLFATASNNDNTGSGLTGFGCLAREVNPTTFALGTVFNCQNSDPAEIGDNAWPPNSTNPTFTADATAILAHILLPENLQHSDFFNGAMIPFSSAFRYVEPAGVERNNGEALTFWRGAGSADSSKLWMQTNGSVQSITNIPNSPGALHALKLSNGKICLAGNLDTDNERKTLYLAVAAASSPTVFDTFYQVATTAVIAPVYSYLVVTDGRGGGIAYPSMVEHGSYLYISASHKKEDLHVWRSLVSGI